jgi:hypothetical protein
MCECTTTINQENPVQIYPVLNQTTGVMEKLIFSVNGLMPGNFYVEDGVEIASAIETDTEGKKTLKVKLKHATDFTNGAIPILKATNHAFEITASQLATLAFDNDTTMVFQQYVGTTPLNNQTNNGCSVSCQCHYVGLYTIHCTCYIRCIGKSPEMKLINVAG